MSWLVEVAKFVVYSGVGFLVGYQVCKIRRNTEEIKEAIVDENPQEAALRHKVEERRHWKVDRQTRIIGLIVMVLSIVTVVQSFYFTHEQAQNSERDKQRTECQAQYNQDFARAVTLRGRYADEDRTQMYKMITTVINEKLTPAQRRQAIEDWVLASQRNDALRKTTPLPNLDARNC